MAGGSLDQHRSTFAHDRQDVKALREARKKIEGVIRAARIRIAFCRLGYPGFVVTLIFIPCKSESIPVLFVL
jgi:hypothetical protein